MLPSTFMSLDRNEKAFIIASIKIKVEDEKKRHKEMESKTRSARKRR